MVPDPTERAWIEPRLTGLLGLDELPAESREELFAAWRTFFERMAAHPTVLLVFWDLQWADQGLLDFIEHLLTWSRTSPIFVLAEARPELFDRRPGWGVTVRSSTSIHLEPLASREMRALLLGLVPGLPDHASRRSSARGGRSALRGRDAADADRPRRPRLRTADGGQYDLVAELPDLDVPETLQALIAARLDALAAQRPVADQRRGRPRPELHAAGAAGRRAARRPTSSSSRAGPTGPSRGPAVLDADPLSPSVASTGSSRAWSARSPTSPSPSASGEPSISRRLATSKRSATKSSRACSPATTSPRTRDAGRTGGRCAGGPGARRAARRRRSSLGPPFACRCVGLSRPGADGHRGSS